MTELSSEIGKMDSKKDTSFSRSSSVVRSLKEIFNRFVLESPGRRSETSMPTWRSASRPKAMTSETGLSSWRSASLKKGVSGKTSDTPCLDMSRPTVPIALARAEATASAMPLSPLARVAAPARVARNAWLEHTLDVAFSFLMCCSRVERTITRHSRPPSSFALPTKRPGVARTILRTLSL